MESESSDIKKCRVGDVECYLIASGVEVGDQGEEVRQQGCGTMTSKIAPGLEASPTPTPATMITP
jgi:hypothetical protein